MDSSNQKSGDFFGLAPFGEAVNTLTRGMVDGAAALLSRLCLPAAEELGLAGAEIAGHWHDTVQHWRAARYVQLLLKTKTILDALPGSEKWRAHPRVVAKILNDGSWSDSDEVQQLWAGLLASACTPDGKDDSNLMFVGFLAQITSSQARVLAFGAENARKQFSDGGLIIPRGIALFVNQTELFEITQISDLNRIDRELDHLNALGLIEAGMAVQSALFVNGKPVAANIRPTPLGFEMYARCKGWRGSAATYNWPPINRANPKPSPKVFPD
jgi:hypothetical protein